MRSEFVSTQISFSVHVTFVFRKAELQKGSVVTESCNFDTEKHGKMYAPDIQTSRDNAVEPTSNRVMGPKRTSAASLTYDK